MSDYQIPAEVLEAAKAAGMEAGLNAVPNPPLRFIDEFLRAAASLMAAAAYRAGREHELRAAADDMEATDGHAEGWADCLNDRPHVKAAGNCIIPPRWLRDRADRIARDYGTEVDGG